MRVVSYIHNAFKLFRQPRDLRGVGALCGRELFSLRLAAFACGRGFPRARPGYFVYRFVLSFVTASVIFLCGRLSFAVLFSIIPEFAAHFFRHFVISCY